MNFYKHHIGDYAKKTGALTMMEHGAYLLMLHAYYGTEKPLPFGRDLYRICRAFGKKERQSVDKVLDLFWTKTDGGFVNGRAFEEMTAATESADASRLNGKKGGRPKKKNDNPSGFENQNPSGSKKEPISKAIQTPDSRLQTPLKSKNQELGAALRANPKVPMPEDFVLTDEMRQACLKRYQDADVDETFIQFAAHHEKLGSKFKSWRAAWTTWLGNMGKFGYAKQKTTVRKWD